jgi:hypothetical protein
MAVTVVVMPMATQMVMVMMMAPVVMRMSGRRCDGGKHPTDCEDDGQGN